MNNDKKYSQYALVREMMETSDIVRNFTLDNTDAVIKAIKSGGKLFFTGEGSSRIFPAKNAMAQAWRDGFDICLASDGARQAMEYRLDKFVVFGASNSGQTKEVIALFDTLKKAGHKNLFGLTANKNTKLETIASQTFVLSCGKEDAVAATKSVAEQALFYHTIIKQLQTPVPNANAGIFQPISGQEYGLRWQENCQRLGDAIEEALTIPIDPAITKAIANAGTVHLSGRNDGVAEELTLKTNEITRKKSDYLEGTYAVHGIEEVMHPEDVVIFINPFPAEIDKINETLVKGVGMKVFAIAPQDTIFPTIRVPDMGELSTFVQLAAGWNILVEVGIALGINLDKPTRARKVGNEFIG